MESDNRYHSSASLSRSNNINFRKKRDIAIGTILARAELFELLYSYKLTKAEFNTYFNSKADFNTHFNSKAMSNKPCISTCPNFIVLTISNQFMNSTQNEETSNL